MQTLMIDNISTIIKESNISGVDGEIIALDFADVLEKNDNKFDRDTFLAKCCSLFHYRHNKKWDGNQWVANPDK